MDADKVFKALADPTRRHVLDQLRRTNGQTLGELCQHLDMARQSATQHIDILQRANLVTTLRRGRERLHYLNPVPIHEIQERWIDKFERPRLHALRAIRRRAEEPGMADSAPAKPRIAMKFLATTIVSAILFAAIYAAVAMDLVSFRDMARQL